MAKGGDKEVARRLMVRKFGAKSARELKPEDRELYLKALAFELKNRKKK
jgi:hypothetical protein